MERLLKHKLLVAVVAVLVAASAGAAYAATQSRTNPRQAFLNDVAKRLNVTPSHLRSAIQGALLDRLDAAVKAGKLTQAQANQIKQRIEQGALPIGPLGGPGLTGPGAFLRHLGPVGPGRGFGAPGPGGAKLGLLSATAKYLDLTETQLLSDLRSGKTLAQVAQAQRKSVNGLEQTLVSAVKARLGQAVASGRITKAQEQRKLSRLNSLINQLVNHARIYWPGKARYLPAPPIGPSGAPPAGGPSAPHGGSSAPMLVLPPGPPPSA